MHFNLALRPADGVILGIPSDGAYTANFTVQVMDANSNTAAIPVQLTVTDPGGGCTNCHRAASF